MKVPLFAWVFGAIGWRSFKHIFIPREAGIGRGRLSLRESSRANG